MEQNPTNQIPAGFYDLDVEVFDEYYGRAVGTLMNGSLSNGVNYADISTGYRHYRGIDSPDTDDWATIELINLMEDVGRFWEEWSSIYGLPEMMVGDASRRTGGQFHPHTQHQQGLEIDVRYIRTDFTFAHSGHLNVCDDPEPYDDLATKELLVTFLGAGDGSRSDLGEVDQIFVGRCMIFDAEALDPRVEIDDSGIHDNHFHVTIRNPDF